MSDHEDDNTDNEPVKLGVRQSRWVKASNVERYDKRTLDALQSYVESQGWHRGARVRAA